MAEIVRMPKLSDTMTVGVVAEWHKKVGDQVESGELLAEIETDKATMEFESFQEGTLLHIGVEKGKEAPVDSILAILGEKGEDVSKLIEEDQKKQAEAKKEEEAPKAAAPAPKAEAPKPAAAAPASTSKKVEVKKVVSTSNTENTGRIFASPLAKKLAEERQINLKFVKGTGDGGRIVKRDIDNYAPSGYVSGIESYRDEPVSQMRAIIGRRLAESKFSAPHFYLTVDVDMDNAISARTAINNQGNGKISFNDLVIKAVGKSLNDHPQVNAGWYGDFIRYNDHVHIGVAMAVDDGLLVPVVKFADQKDVHTISAEVKDFATRAKAKKLNPDEWSGNTFTISNLGMFGIEEFTAIINPPDACILAVGAIRQEPVVKNGEIVPGNRMKLTLSCDHRVVDGAIGAPFLNSVKKYLEDPVLIFV